MSPKHAYILFRASVLLLLSLLLRWMHNNVKATPKYECGGWILGLEEVKGSWVGFFVFFINLYSFEFFEALATSLTTFSSPTLEWGILLLYPGTPFLPLPRVGFIVGDSTILPSLSNFISRIASSQLVNSTNGGGGSFISSAFTFHAIWVSCCLISML